MRGWMYLACLHFSFVGGEWTSMHCCFTQELERTLLNSQEVHCLGCTSREAHVNACWRKTWYKGPWYFLEKRNIFPRSSMSWLHFMWSTRWYMQTQKLLRGALILSGEKKPFLKNFNVQTALHVNHMVVHADENSGTRGPYTFRREGALYLTFDILSKFSGGRRWNKKIHRWWALYQVPNCLAASNFTWWITLQIDLAVALRSVQPNNPRATWPWGKIALGLLDIKLNGPWVVWLEDYKRFAKARIRKMRKLR